MKEIYQHYKANSSTTLADIAPNKKKFFDCGKKRGRKELKVVREELKLLQEKLYADKKKKVLIVFQAMDTAGKDSAIKKIFSGLNPNGINVANFKKPTRLELERDYLWRIHKRVPRKGRIVIFNRSHYEDIIAVRVRQLLPEATWQKRYEHINNFEKLLSDEGCLILKFFLHINKEEQKERLQARLDNPDKNWKFNPSDLNDRAKWQDFQQAYQDVIQKTSTNYAPWFVIPANQKWHKDLVTANITLTAMGGLKLKFPQVDFEPEKIEIE